LVTGTMIDCLLRYRLGKQERRWPDIPLDSSARAAS
jgi:hypothetical protein